VCTLRHSSNTIQTKINIFITQNENILLLYLTLQEKHWEKLLGVITLILEYKSDSARLKRFFTHICTYFTDTDSNRAISLLILEWLNIFFPFRNPYSFTTHTSPLYFCPPTNTSLSCSDQLSLMFQSASRYIMALIFLVWLFFNVASR